MEKFSTAIAGSSQQNCRFWNSSIGCKNSNCRFRWISFDGMHTHWPTAISQGTRYSVVAFNFADRG